MISLRQIKYFVEIVDAASFTRAADRLYIAQSALSRQTKELEDELQVTLLERDARHIEVTPAGRFFYERCRRILEDVDDAVQQTKQVGRGGVGTLRLLHSSSVTLTTSIGALLERLLGEFPGVTLDVSKAASDHQAADIEEGRADLGLARPPILRKYPNLVVTELFSERLMVAVSAQHSLSARTHTGIDRLRDEAFVSIPHKDRGGLSYLVAGLCVQHGFFPKAARATSRKTSLLNLVEANLGIAIVPESLREVAPRGVHFLELDDESAHSSVALIYRRDATLIVSNFARALVQHMAGVSA